MTLATVAADAPAAAPLRRARRRRPPHRRRPPLRRPRPPRDQPRPATGRPFAGTPPTGTATAAGRDRVGYRDRQEHQVEDARCRASSTRARLCGATGCSRRPPSARPATRASGPGLRRREARERSVRARVEDLRARQGDRKDCVGADAPTPACRRPSGTRRAPRRTPHRRPTARASSPSSARSACWSRGTSTARSGGASTSVCSTAAGSSIRPSSGATRARPIIYRNSVILQADIRRARTSRRGISRRASSSGRRPCRMRSPHGARLRSCERPTARDELVTNGTKVRGYDPATGKLLWTLGPNSEITVGTPVAGHGLVFVTGGYPPVRPIYAIRPGATGDISLPKGQDSSERDGVEQHDRRHLHPDAARLRRLSVHAQHQRHRHGVQPARPDSARSAAASARAARSRHRPSPPTAGSISRARTARSTSSPPGRGWRRSRRTT